MWTTLHIDYHNKGEFPVPDFSFCFDSFPHGQVPERSLATSLTGSISLKVKWLVRSFSFFCDFSQMGEGANGGYKHIQDQNEERGTVGGLDRSLFFLGLPLGLSVTDTAQDAQSIFPFQRRELHDAPRPHERLSNCLLCPWESFSASEFFRALVSKWGCHSLEIPLWISSTGKTVTEGHHADRS